MKKAMEGEARARELTGDLHQALRGRNLSERLRGLLLFREVNSDESTQSAGSAFIRYCLAGLGEKRPQEAELLSRRFLEKESIKSIALRSSMSEEQVNRRQRAAIETLAEWILAHEREEAQGLQGSVSEKLPPASYTQLFGVKAVSARLASLLQPANSPWVIALIGLGGLGKTAIADATVRGLIPRFPYKHLIWLRAGSGEANGDGGSQLIVQLSRELLPATTATSEQSAELRRFLKAQPSLIVFDNLDAELQDLAWVELLHDLAHPSKFLLTSRRFAAPLAQVFAMEIPQLGEEDAMAMFAFEAHQRGMETLASDLPKHSAHIYERTGGNPLALRLVAGLLQAWSLPATLAALEGHAAGDVEQMYGVIFEQSWRALSVPARRLLRVMTLAGSEGAQEDQLQAISKLSKADLQTALFELRQRSLLEMRGDVMEARYGIHPLTETFLQHKALQAELRVYQKANLAFWIQRLKSDQKAEILKSEAGNLKLAAQIGFGAGLERDAIDLIQLLFSPILKLGAAQDWIHVFETAQDYAKTKGASVLLANLEYCLGALRWQLGQNGLAMDLFSRSLDTAKRRGLVRQKLRSEFGLCLCNWSIRNYDEAWRIAQEMEAGLGSMTDSEHLKASGYAVLGIMAYAAKKYDTAILHFQKALKIFGGGNKRFELQARTNLGLSLMAKRRYRDCLSEYNAAAALATGLPDSEDYLLNIEILRASAHYEKNKIPQAKAALIRAAQLLNKERANKPARALLENLLGRTHFDTDDAEKALSYLRSATTLWNQLGDSWMLLETQETIEKIGRGHRRAKRRKTTST